MDDHSVLGVLDLCHLGVEAETRVVFLEKGRRFTLNDSAVAAGVNDEVVCITELVESEVLAGDSEDEGASFGGICVFPV